MMLKVEKFTRRYKTFAKRNIGWISNPNWTASQIEPLRSQYWKREHFNT